MSGDDSVYRRLREHLDALPVPYPATRSGVELRLLKRFFTPEEAEVALGLSAAPEPADTIQGRLPGRSKEDVEQILGRMADKGAIFRMPGRDGGARYMRAPMVVGIYEAQVDRLTREAQEDFDQYGREGFAAALLAGRTKQMRTIPVNARLVPDRKVGRYDDARRIVEEGAGPWAARNCVCRQGRELLGEPCRQTNSRRVCLMIGPAATTSVASGEAQPLTRDETQALLDQAEREGMVLQPSNARDPIFMCLCCGCCCGMLRAARQFPRPADYLQSNYRAVVDSELCTECETCRERCPMDALSSVEGATVVDDGRCIGCGLCVTTCPTGAARLQAKDDVTVPPRSLPGLYGRIMRERFGVLGAATRIGRLLLGRQV